MRIATRLGLVALAALALLLAGCTSCSVNQNPDQLKQHTAQATAALKRDAKAVAAGVRQGWSGGNPVNLNTATKPQLETLPGMDAAQADRIVAHRPYTRPDELLSRRVLSRREYNRIAPLVTTGK